ncbi:MAG: ABC transporter ATP-binding protein [Clostridia bacterium]|nr:ABC transporter ATP-binding protein [Clostridia bacterium]
MARNNDRRPERQEDFNLVRERAQAERAAEARARSIAKAQSAARAKAIAKAKAEARIRAMMIAEGEIPPEEVQTDAVQEPIEEIPAADAVEALENNGSPMRAPDELEFAIQIRELYKAYGKKQVLKGLSLDVYPGELFGFIGRNGIGKSTTIDCMIGAKRFSSGEITVGGYDIRREPIEAKCSYGYVASEPTCYEVMTGYDYLEFVASIYQLTETEFQGNYKYLCRRLQLNLQELTNHISGYSHGMKQKLCLVASLLHNPNIWILDEPTVGLDIMAQEELKKMMREYANHGKTVFVTSHNIELVSAICDRVAIINDGVVKAVYDLKKNPEHRAQLPKLFLEIYGG